MPKTDEVNPRVGLPGEPHIYGFPIGLVSEFEVRPVTLVGI
jgi:hypothetical protein